MSLTEKHQGCQNEVGLVGGGVGRGVERKATVRGDTEQLIKGSGGLS